MTETQYNLEDLSKIDEDTANELHSEDHLASRCMFLKEFDLLDIDHGHFWYKLSWHGVHVEFPSPQYHYEANPHERLLRDYFLSLPVDVLDAAFSTLQEATEYAFDSGEHHFRLVWDHELRPHLHCYYHRSSLGHQRDAEVYQQRLQEHALRYESGRQFPSKRLLQKLEWLREEHAKAQQTVDALHRQIVMVEEEIALDQIVHTGKVEAELEPIGSAAQ
jgi:hypothetical protein